MRNRTCDNDEPEADEDQLETTPPHGEPEPARRARVGWGQTVGVDALEEFHEDAFVPMPWYEPYRPVELVPVGPAEGEPVRAVGQYWAEPRPGVEPWASLCGEDVNWAEVLSDHARCRRGTEFGSDKLRSTTPQISLDQGGGRGERVYSPDQL